MTQKYVRSGIGINLIGILPNIGMPILCPQISRKLYVDKKC